MFPMLNLETSDLAPECYFGGCEVPPYQHVRLSDPADLKDLLETLRNIGGQSNSSGYIDSEGIHFHLPEDDEIQVDLSRRFIFVSQPEADGPASPSAWQVMFFLMEPVRKALFVTGGRLFF